MADLQYNDEHLKLGDALGLQPMAEVLEPRQRRSLPFLAPNSIGVGRCEPHFGEIFQGVVASTLRGHRRLERALVTCPVPFAVGSIARFDIDPSASGGFLPFEGPTGIDVRPRHYSKCARAARLTLDHLGFHGFGGKLSVETRVPEGAGMASSTSGVVSTIRAVVASISAATDKPLGLTPHEVAKISVQAEGASDSIMFDHRQSTPLFAHRIGKVIKTFYQPLPRMIVLGFNTSNSGIETDFMERARYSQEQIEIFGCALELLGRGIKEQSVDLIGRVATISAEICQTAAENPLHKPMFGQIKDIMAITRAAGILVSHSGTVAGLIYDPATANVGAQIRAAHIQLSDLGIDNALVFATPY